jgi:essential nuclear protein 1
MSRLHELAEFSERVPLPLCKKNCTLREAAIVKSVLARVPIPTHYTAVVFVKSMGQLECSRTSSIFIKTLLDKVHSLPASPVLSSLASATF